MATLKSIRKRITSVKNTQKITRAMKMVAAAKLRRAQQTVVALRPYADQLGHLLNSVAQKNESPPHLFFAQPDKVQKSILIVFSSNRGLCGGFNSNLLRKVETFLMGLEKRNPVDLFVIGKKGREFFRARKREIKEVSINHADSLTFDQANNLAQKMLDGYLKGEYDEYYMAYNRFKSALSQEVSIRRFIPYSVSTKDTQTLNGALNLVDFLYEPSKDEFLEKVIPWQVSAELYRAHKESTASELGARMTAMENATNNASEMIRLLTLKYNRLRQQAITTELMDIVNGAEAIK